MTFGLCLKELPEETLPDIQSYKKAKRLIELSENDPESLFLAVGFHKPHIPLKFPAKFLGNFLHILKINHLK